MTNHPNRSATMHHFSLNADRATGEWHRGSIEYLGLIKKADFCALTDTDDVHYDQHDGEVFAPEAMAEAGVETKQNVALTINFVD